MEKKVTNIFKLSAFGKKLCSNNLSFPAESNLTSDELGVTQPYVIVGDEAFALHRNLLRPFPGRSLNDQRRIFNYRLSRARQTIECSFGILTKKWRVFQTSIMVELNYVIDITKACCILHNFIRRRDGFNYEDTLSCSLEDVTTRIGIGNSSTLAKNVTGKTKSLDNEYFYLKHSYYLILFHVYY